ncbi:MAG: sugar phosphate isomerase/epimerase [Chloroflexota bacterium]|nr:MAG: xylose isomerase [Chloroflexota bacterium]
MAEDIRLAAAPVSWGVTEVAAGAARLPWTTVMDEIAAAGYEATELGPYGYYPTDPAELRAALAVRGLTLTSAFVPLPLHDMRAFPAAVDEVLRIGELLAALGAEYIVLSSAGDALRMGMAGQVPPDQTVGMDDAAWDAAAQAVEGLARRCLALGLRSVFHHHAGTYVETPHELRLLCERTDPELVGICLDTAHYVYGGGDPRAALAEYGERIRYVHLKDIYPERLGRARDEKWDFVTAVERGVFAPLGQGSAQIAGCVADLRARGYRGWAVVEQDMLGERDADGRTPLEGMSAAREYLRGLGL